MNAVIVSKFPGFSPAALRFLASLKRHNNREWFIKNKAVYQQEIREPLEALIAILASEFERIAPEMMATPKISLYRIYRDTRFSKNKAPYKTHIAAVFPPRGLDKHEGAAFYFHFSPDELLVGGGLYMPSPEGLLAVREHIVRHFARLDSILHARSFRKTFGELSGSQLSRVPRGFSADLPAAAYLRYKQFLAGRNLPADIVTTPGFQRTLVETFTGLYPLVRFLNEPIIKNRRLRQKKEALIGRTERA